MPHHSNEKGVKALKEIIKRAKEIQKEHPKKDWKNCVKEASHEYKQNKK